MGATSTFLLTEIHCGCSTKDHNGNRLHKTQNGQTDTYTYQANAYNSSLHTDELQKVNGGLTGTKTYGYDTNGVARSITTNGTTLYLTADAEDRYTRFDFNTGAGQGSVYSTASYNGTGLRTFHHDAQGHDFPQAYDGVSPGSALLSSAGTLFTPAAAASGGFLPSRKCPRGQPNARHLTQEQTSQRVLKQAESKADQNRKP